VASSGSFRPLALVAAASLLLTACGTDGESPLSRREGGMVSIAPDDPITIGISTMLEGDLSSVGTALRDAAQLAGEGVTVAGHEIRFVAANDGCTEEGGARAAEQLLEEDALVAVVGPSCSDAVLGAQPVYEDAGITHISQLSTNILTTQPEGREPYGTFLRTAFNDQIQGQEQAAFAERELGADSAFIVFEAFRYGGAADTFRSTFGGNLVGDEGFQGEEDFPGIVGQIGEEAPDLVYFSGFYPTGIPFVEELRSSGYDGPVLAGDAMYDQELIDGLGELAETEMYITLPSPPLEGPTFEEFRASYQEAYGSDPTATSFTAESYDAATAIITSVQEVAQESEGGGLEVDLDALNDAIRSSSFEGASGPIRFDENGDRIAEGIQPVTVFVVRDGSFTPFTQAA
jgi:branched-chain amino acid transport system substrate-binding protein